MQGNPGKRPLNKNEPVVPVEIPECPDHLDDIAKAEWERIVPELAKAGLLTQLDRTALSLYCQTWAIWIDAETKVKKRGRVFTTKSGHPIQNPFHNVATKAATDLKNFAIEFGLTPSARSRIDVDTMGETADPIRLFTLSRNA